MVEGGGGGGRGEGEYTSGVDEVFDSAVLPVCT